jgi:hypothetical protein
MSGGHHLHAQPEDTPCRDERDPRNSFIRFNACKKEQMFCSLEFNFMDGHVKC